MKKFTAILVMTAMSCSCVACGQDTADEVTEESSVTSVAEVTEETTEEITESETDETSEEDTDGEEVSETENENSPSETVSADGSYEEAIEMLLECMNNRDVEGMLKLSFPDKYIDVMKTFAEISGGSFEDIATEVKESDETMHLVEIVSAEPMSSEDLEMLTEMYGYFEVIWQYAEENDIDAEKLQEFMSEADMEEMPKPYFETTDGQIVNCILESEDENGNKETSEAELMMYYIDGEGWKTDLSMMGYVKKSKQTSINSNAKTFMVASNTVLVDLDEMGVELPEKCIICSDTSKNYNVSDDFLSKFEENMENYFSDYKKFDYIIVIEDGCCTYLACTDPENSKFTGTYPANKLYSADGDPVTMDRVYSFDEIYQLCLDEIQK